MEVYASAILLLATFSEIVDAKSVLSLVDESSNDVAAAISLKARIKNKKSQNDVSVSFETLIDVEDLHRIVNILVNSPYYVNDQANNENLLNAEHHGIVQEGTRRAMPRGKNPIEDSLAHGTDSITAFGTSFTSLLKMGVEPFLGSASTGGPSLAPYNPQTPIRKCDKLLYHLIEAYQEVIASMQNPLLSRRRFDSLDHEMALTGEEDASLQEKIHDDIEDRKKHQTYNRLAKEQLPGYRLHDGIAEEEEHLTSQRRTDSFDHEHSETDDSNLQEKIYESIKELQAEIERLQNHDHETASRRLSDEIYDEDENKLEGQTGNEAGFIKTCTFVPIDAKKSQRRLNDDESDIEDHETPEGSSASTTESRPSLEQQIHEDREEHLQETSSKFGQNGTSGSNLASEKQDARKSHGKVSLGNSLKMVKKTSVHRKHQHESTEGKSWSTTKRRSGLVVEDKSVHGKKSTKTDEKQGFETSPKTDEQAVHDGTTKITQHKVFNEDGSEMKDQSGHVMEELIRAMHTGGQPQQQSNQPGIGNQKLDDF